LETKKENDMSIYLRKDRDDPRYFYDFQLGGKRFSGCTEKTTKREAEAEEKRLKTEAQDAVKREQVVTAERLTVEAACARYWHEKQADYSNRDHLLWSLGWLKDHLGATTMLDALDDNRIARMVAARRGEKNRNFKHGDRLISKTTVNDMTRTLQRIHNRARLTWKLQVQAIDWKQHRLKEPQERIREASPAEEAALLANLPRGFDAPVRFVNRIGARRMELINLDWTDVDWFNRRITLRGKGDKTRIVPMPSDIYELLWSLKDHHPVKVFTFVAERTRNYPHFRGQSYVRGVRYPLTVPMVKYTFKVAKKAAGIVDYRFHDGRHTAATRLLRKSGNLRHVQTLLGHASIKTTLRYAHVTMDDLAAAMEGAAPAKPHDDAKGPTNSPTKSPVKSVRD
jgi:integrase